VVGSFRLTERIGAGGMGTVYRGVALAWTEPRTPPPAAGALGGGLGPAVAAVKFLTPALAGERGVTARFAREMKVLRGLDHPGIVGLYDHGTLDGVPWFAMELVEGPDLRTRLGGGRLSPSEIAQVFPRLLDALAHAHARGVVHRDLKPANVLLGNGAAKLADFGIALAIGSMPGADPATAATPLTETAAVIGTLPYMSPEQRSGSRVDSRSDLYSVGVMLYESATGRLPWGAFAPPSRVNRAFSPRFDRVVARLLQPEPEARFPSAAATANALREVLRPGRVAPRVMGAGAAAVLAATLGLGVPALSHFQGGRAVILEDSGALGGLRQAGMLPSPVFPPMLPPAQNVEHKRRPFGELRKSVSKNVVMPPRVKRAPSSPATKVRKMEMPEEDITPPQSRLPPLFVGGVKPAPRASWQQMSSPQAAPSQQAVPSQQAAPSQLPSSSQLRE
jgi:serine/threonine-protein kinase